MATGSITSGSAATRDTSKPGGTRKVASSLSGVSGLPARDAGERTTSAAQATSRVSRAREAAGVTRREARRPRIGPVVIPYVPPPGGMAPTLLPAPLDEPQGPV